MLYAKAKLIFIYVFMFKFVVSVEKNNTIWIALVYIYIYSMYTHLYVNDQCVKLDMLRMCTVRSASVKKGASEVSALRPSCGEKSQSWICLETHLSPFC